MMINIENISLNYALNHLNAHIPRGKLVGIMGANGAGKSTLLKAIAGILPLAQGEIYFGEKALSQMSPLEKSRQFAYLAQSSPIYWDLSVSEVIDLALPTFAPKGRQNFSAIYQRFAIEHLLDKPYQTLSGGEKTRVQLARCGVANTPILLADEPIAALDPYYQIDIMQQLKALTPERTCVLAIHHLQLAYEFCDEIILLKNGNILAAGKTEEVLTEGNLAAAFTIYAEINRAKREISRIKKSAI